MKGGDIKNVWLTKKGPKNISLALVGQNFVREYNALGKMCKLSQQMTRDDANYEEAQSRLRMSMLCRGSVRPLVYPLSLRIVELAQRVRLGEREP